MPESFNDLVPVATDADASSSMASASDAAAIALTLETWSASLGLSIPATCLPGVVEQWGNLAAIAQPLLAFPIPQTLDPAPRFTPQEPDPC